MAGKAENLIRRAHGVSRSNATEENTLGVPLCISAPSAVRVLIPYADSRLRRWNLRRRFLIILSLCLQVRALPHERHFGHVSNLRPFGILHENPGIFQQ